MIVINGGLPRSGTVLVGAIVMGIARRENLRLVRFSPQERRDSPEFQRQIAEWDGNGVLLIHTHLADPKVVAALSRREDHVVFWNHRDPRDAVVSLCRLHDLPLDFGLEAMNVYLRVEKLMSEQAFTKRLRYEEIVTDEPELVRLIANRMGVELRQAEIDRIVEETSVSAHKKIMQSVTDGSAEDLMEYETRFRKFREDRQTLINDRHIQSGKPGRWRTELTHEEQQMVMIELAPWVEALGYSN